MALRSRLPAQLCGWMVGGLAALIAVSCSGSDEVDEPAAVVTPTSTRTVDGPTFDNDTRGRPLSAVFVASLGDDRVLVGTSSGVWADGTKDPVGYAVGSLDEESWRDIDGPPDVDGMRLIAHPVSDLGAVDIVTVDGDVYLVGGRCGHYDTSAEGESYCGSFGDFEMWRLAAEDLKWDQVMAASFDELTGAPKWSHSAVLGVIDGQIWVSLVPDQGGDTSIVALNPDSGEVETVDRYNANDQLYVSLRCATGSGTLVGWVTGRLATLEPTQGWVVHDDITLGASDPVACGADTVVMILEEDNSPLTVYPTNEVPAPRSPRWVEANATGDVMADGVLTPGLYSPNDIHTYILDGEVGFAALTNTEVVIAARVADDPLVHELEPATVHMLDGATSLHGGRVVALVALTDVTGGEESDGDQWRTRTQLLIAE